MQKADAHERQLADTGSDLDAEAGQLDGGEQNAGGANELEDRAGLSDKAVERHGFLRLTAQCRAMVTNVTQNMHPTRKAVSMPESASTCRNVLAVCLGGDTIDA